MKMLVVGDPSDGTIRIVKSIDPDDGLLLIGDVAFNAMLVAFASTYEEALQICKKIEDDLNSNP